MKDLPFYEVVMEKRKNDNAYLVTGNYRKNVQILPFCPKKTLADVETGDPSFEMKE